MANEPVLQPEEVASVLEGGVAVAEREPEGSTVYSLRRPLAIASGEEATARARMQQFVNTFRDTLNRELHSELTIELEGFRQEQVAAAVDSVPKPAWVLSFSAKEGGGLALAIDPSCALIFVELALGGAGTTAEKGRGPTALETRVMESLCETLAPALREATGVRLTSGRFTGTEVPERLAAPGQTVGVGMLELTLAESKLRGLLLVTPPLLRPPEGRRRNRHRPEPGPLARHLVKARVETRAVLKACPVSLADLRALQPGTVLRFGIPADTPLDLQVNGRDVFRGRIERDGSGPRFRIEARRGRRMTIRDDEEK